MKPLRLDVGRPELIGQLKERDARVKELETQLEKMFETDLTAAALLECETEIQSLRRLAMIGYYAAEQLAEGSGRVLTREFHEPFELLMKSNPELVLQPDES